MFHDMLKAEQDATLRLYVLRAYLTAGEAELALGQDNEAGADFQNAVDTADKLVRDDPDQAYTRLDEARAKRHLAQVLAVDGQCSQAEQLFQQATEEWKSLSPIGILVPAEMRQAASLEAAMEKCRP